MLPFFNQKELVVCSNQSQYQKCTCVRVTNSDQLAIQNVLNNQSQKTGVLEIIERDT